MPTIYAVFGPDGITIINIFVAAPKFVFDHCPTAMAIQANDPVPGIEWRRIGTDWVAPA